MKRLLLMLLLFATVAAAAQQRWAVAIFPNGSEFGLEIAETPQQRARGYMFRESIGEYEGMLFLFEEDDRHSFWMKNCEIALDLIWLDQHFRVVEIQTDVPPCKKDPCPSYAPMRAGRYVLEVGAGRSVAEGLKVGDQLTILADPEIR